MLRVAGSQPTWFTPSSRYSLGPLASAKTLDRFVAFAQADHAALGSGRSGPDSGTLTADYEQTPVALRLRIAPALRDSRLACALVGLIDIDVVLPSRLLHLST